jgi:hypothetical protein
MPPLTLDSPIAILGIKTEAPKILTGAGIRTVRQLIAMNRADAAKIDGLGDKRLDAIDTALTAHRLRWKDRRSGIHVCTDCPACETCGNPRATSRKAVVQDYLGRYKHTGFDNLTPPCDDCRAHHRALIATAAA